MTQKVIKNIITMFLSYIHSPKLHAHDTNKKIQSRKRNNISFEPFSTFSDDIAVEKWK